MLVEITIATRSTQGHRIGGMETYVDVQLSRFVALGHTVSLVTTLGMSEEYEEHLAALGVRVVLVPKAASNRYDSEWHGGFRDAVASIGSAVCICHGLAGLTLRPATNMRVITLTHGAAPLAMWNSALGARPFRSLASRVRTYIQGEPLSLRRHELVSLSSFDAVLTAFATIRASKSINIVPPALNSRPVDSEGRARERIIVLAARLDRSKGVPEILKAWNSIESKGFRLVVAGTGPESALVESVARSNSTVTYLGPMSTSQVGELMARAMWSVTGGRYRESFGLAAAESMVSGTPVIYAGRGALPETVAGGGIRFKSQKSLRIALQEAVSMQDSSWYLYSERASTRSRAFEASAYDSAWSRLLEGTQR